ncbi:uncharacterized protein PV07_05358 [Cladophialophora immunda]|uniref:C2H2-type domain-containing protein n=1 Tax=Cladophialophora immunda TaxID=569365 RepID=A0A0D1ZNP3_9EURO|nr:uncharacterized protein PV07_05358 [Cladophialophora immunda]KIW29546.1 hypothetical protein PV07_05358 [Cladophialophora immunda]
MSFADNSTINPQPKRTWSRRRNTPGTAPVICTICGKSFARKDVLTRHVRLKHQDPQAHRTSYPRKRTSCLRCALYKVKCVGTPTCARCDKHGVFCQFDFSAKRPRRALASSDQSLADEVQEDANTSTTQTQSAEWTALPSYPPDVPHDQEPAQREGTCSENFRRDEDRLQATPFQLDLSPEHASLQLCEAADSSSHRNHDIGLDKLDMTMPVWENDGTWNDHSTMMNETLTAPSPCSGFTMFWDNLCAEGLLQDTVALGRGGATRGRHGEIPALQYLEAANQEGIFESDPGNGLNSPSMAVPAPPLLQGRMISTTSTRQDDEPISAGTDSAVSQGVSEDSDSNSSCSLPWRTQSTTIADMYDRLKPPSGLTLFRDIPRISHSEAACYWTLYFTHFHPRFPILHCGTLSVVTCTPLLLGAITAIGAGFSSQATAREYSVTTVGTLCALLSRTNSHLPESIQQEGFVRLVIRCLVYFHIIESDMHALLDFAIAAQASLVRDARKSMLFTLDDEADPGHMSCRPSRSPSREQDGQSPKDLEKWYTWVYHEQRKRLVCAVIVVHCRSCLMTGVQPVITDEEFDIYQPCTEKLWEALDPQSWRASFPWTQKPPRNPPLRGALIQSLDDEQRFKNIPFLGRLIADYLLRLIDVGLIPPRLLSDCSARVLSNRRLLLVQQALKEDAVAMG